MTPEQSAKLLECELIRIFAWTSKYPTIRSAYGDLSEDLWEMVINDKNQDENSRERQFRYLRWLIKKLFKEPFSKPTCINKHDRIYKRVLDIKGRTPLFCQRTLWFVRFGYTHPDTECLNRVDAILSFLS